MHGDGGPPQTPAADHDLLDAGVADHHPGGAGRLRVGEVGAGAAEATGVLVDVQEHGEPAVQGLGVGREVGGDVAEHRRGELGVRSFSAEDPAVRYVPGRGREGPGNLVPVRGGVHTRVQRPPGARTAAGDLHQQPHQLTACKRRCGSPLAASQSSSTPRTGP
jgi:hypothetical protein